MCKNLKLVQAEVAFMAAVNEPQQQLLFQLPTEALPLLRHCTGWRKDWLFSLGVCGVKVASENVISVQEMKISQLRLQEDPGKWSWRKMCPGIKTHNSWVGGKCFNYVNSAGDVEMSQAWFSLVKQARALKRKPKRKYK